MNWDDSAYLVSKNRYSENSIIAEVNNVLPVFFITTLGLLQIELNREYSILFEGSWISIIAASSV